MSFVFRMMRFLFWLLVLSWGVALLRRALRWMLGGSASAPQQNQTGAGEPPAAGTGRKLVRDPVCGVHVAEVLAIPLREQGELMHFCSTACRDKYVASIKKFAANG
jgi:YHS domain-containing protein